MQQDYEDGLRELQSQLLKWISLHELQSNILNVGAKAMAGNNAQPSCQTPLTIGSITSGSG